MHKVILYHHRNDFEIDKLIVIISQICEKYSLDFLPIDLDNLENELNNTQHTTPNLVVGPYNLKFPFTIKDAEIAISAVSMKPERTKKASLKESKKRNRLGIFLARFYPSIIGLIIAIFVSGAFLPPLLLQGGKVSMANAFYGFYKIFCHQLAFRSFFINGEQVFYPRALSNINNVITYEQEFNDPFDDVNIARKITGNSVSGYKIALCERDLAIYLSLAMVSFVFQVFRKKIRPIRWYIWVIVGLIPIAIDGFSQIPGLSAGWPAWFPVRESTPFLRLITGTLFGGATALYMFPLMEESMTDTLNQLLLQREVIRVSEKVIQQHEKK